MKIGILTFHCPHNYGAVLQAYALQQYLLKLGYEVEIIDYRPKYLINATKLKINWRVFVSIKPIKCLRKLYNGIFHYIPSCYKRYIGFNKFINKKLVLSARVSNDKIPDNYDAYIIGSDQVWNSKITCGFDRVYFAQFPFEKKQKKYISYAASIGSDKLTKNEKNCYTYLLSNFDYIGVREYKLVELLQPLCLKKIEHVLDPTLLVETDIWDKIALSHNYKKNYVLVYTGLAKTDSIINIAQKIAKPQGFEIMVLTGQISEYTINGYRAASPEEFVNAFKNASFVITSTFHGTAFSIIFNKNFYTLKLNKEDDSRAMSLLSMLGLEDRMIDSSADVLQNNIIDWNSVNDILKINKEKSKAFLKNALA